MRKLILPSALVVLFPLTALALNYADRSWQYKDAPFSKAEAVAISVLTNLGAVSGNPDGTFAPDRSVNRAEFLKIALKSHPTISVSSADAQNCFPDVRKPDWFSSAVCLAKQKGIVGGYPDGLFKPGRPVNYVEALKMLEILYDVPWNKQCVPLTPNPESPCNWEDLKVPSGSPWYQLNVDWARKEGLLLPISISYDFPLTRGQVARLVASFRANADGELAKYREAELGKTSSSSSTSQSSASSVSSVASSASSASSESSASSVSSTSSVSSASSSSSVTLDLPARSHLLLLGQKTPALASAVFTAPLEPVRIRIAEVTLRQKASFIDSLELVDDKGVLIGRLPLYSGDINELTWRTTFDSSGAYLIPKGAEQVLAVRARLKDRSSGGFPEKIVEVDKIKLSVDGEWSGTSYNSAPTTMTYPQHQTAQGQITSVTNALSPRGVLPVGSNQMLAAFSFSGTAVPGAYVAVENLEFQVSKSSGIVVSNWQLGAKDSAVRVQCSVNASTISCLAIPAEIGVLSSSGPLVLQLFGDVAVDQGAQSQYLKVDLNDPGMIGSNGAVRWTDGVGHYTWTELSNPIAGGTDWEL
jgi:hypothetical protein